jgi:hypothetical protein
LKEEKGEFNVQEPNPVMPRADESKTLKYERRRIR